MLAISVFEAIRDAVGACGAGLPLMSAPATPETILHAIEALRTRP